ncbi:DUF3175 domain-containing protein (plasmid) [Burkholderia gladioli]|nr:DUF3175 domain-containing protein [Burkholderia gladioli]
MTNLSKQRKLISWRSWLSMVIIFINRAAKHPNG